MASYALGFEGLNWVVVNKENGSPAKIELRFREGVAPSLSPWELVSEHGEDAVAQKLLGHLDIEEVPADESALMLLFYNKLGE